MGKLKAIQTCPQLSALEPLELAFLSSITELRKLQEGQTLFTAGESGDTLFLIVDGSLAVFGEGVDDGEPLLRLEAGELLAEMALLGDSRHRVTARIASDQATLACIPRESMRRLMAAKPEVAAKLLAAIGAVMNEKIEAALR